MDDIQKIQRFEGLTNMNSFGDFHLIRLQSMIGQPI